jgi:23S rRNA (guanosine2251-2'-O)-methyltransferase
MPELIYGRHAVEETLRAGRRRVTRVLIAEGGRGGPEREEGVGGRLETVLELARGRKVAVERVPMARLDHMLRVGGHHQGVAAEASPFPYTPFPEVEKRCREAGGQALVVLLDSVQDPQNFGTLLRTCEAVGVTAVVIMERRQVEVTPAVVNASAGAVEHLAVSQVNNLSRAIESLQEAGLWVYALSAEEGASLYTSTDLKGGLGLVVGSEGRGVGKLVRERCDGAVSIPMLGKVESLNAGVAGSIVLYEALRQRGV